MSVGLEPQLITPPGTDAASAALSDLARRVAALEAVRGFVGTGTITGSNISTTVGSQIVTSNIQAGAINASLLSVGAVTAGAISVSSLSAISANMGTLTAGSITATATIHGNAITAGTVLASALSVSQLSAISANLGTVTAGTLTGATVQTAASGARVVIDSAGIRGINASAVTKFEFSTATGILSATAVVTAEAGSNIPAPYISGTIGNTQIADDSISTPKLQANSVVAAKISVATLSAITADLGTITAGTITGATMRTSSSVPRVQLDSAGFQVWEPSGAQNFDIASSTGIIRMRSGDVYGAASLTHVSLNPSATTNTTNVSTLSTGVTLTRDTTVFNSSPASFKAAVGAAIAGGQSGQGIRGQLSGVFKGGTTYRIKFQLRTSRASGAFLTIRTIFGRWTGASFLDQTDNGIAMPATSWQPITIDWTPSATYTAQATDDISYAVTLSRLNGDPAIDFWVDDVEIYELLPAAANQLRFVDALGTNRLVGVLQANHDSKWGTSLKPVMALDATPDFTQVDMAAVEVISRVGVREIDAGTLKAAVEAHYQGGGGGQSSVRASLLRASNNTVTRKMILDEDFNSDFMLARGEHVRVYRTTSPTYATGSTTTLIWDAEDYDVTSDAANNHHDNVTNNTRLTCRRAGVYFISAGLSLSGGGPCQISCRRNGSQYIGRAAWSNNYFEATLGFVHYLLVGDYIELLFNNASGANRTLNTRGAGGGIIDDMHFGMSRLGDTA